MRIELRFTPEEKIYSQLEEAILCVLEENPLPLAELTRAVNLYVEEELGELHISQPEMARIARDLCAQRKVEYRKAKYAINYRGVL